MWRHLSQLAVVVVAVLILTSCGTAEPPEVAVLVETQIGDLVAEGYSAEVASCATGLADGVRIGDSRAELIDACERAEAILNAPEEAPVEVEVEGPVAYGDDAELDALWDRCETGDGTACDQLWELAPLDSDYERFGITCGEREDVLNCADLSPDPVPVD